jgi:WD40 repeat protein
MGSIEALLELDSLSRDLKWHESFFDLEIDEELRQLKQTLGINHITESPGKYDWEILESQEKLNQLKEQLEELFKNNQFQENSFYSYPPTSENNNQIITINISRSVWQSKILKTIENNDFSSLTITSDSKYLFTGNVNGTIFQWDLTTCQHLFTFTSGRSEIMATEVSPDQKRLLAAGFDRRISEWNIQSKGIFIGVRVTF